MSDGAPPPPPYGGGPDDRDDPYASPPRHGQQPPPPPQYGQGGQPQYGQGYPGAPQYGYEGGAPYGQPRVASMGKRLGARVIDGILLGIVGAILGSILLGGTEQPLTDASGRIVNMSEILADNLASLVLGLVISLVYEVSLIGSRGATLGKQLLKIKVVREADGAVPGFGPAGIRWAVPTVGILACCVGQIVVYLSPFFDSTKRNRGWHDKAAKTIVVEA